MKNDSIPRLTTLCYIEKDGKYLMLHRTKKENDINKDKYIGIGGHFEYGESPEECLIREVKEETGLTLSSYRARGIVTFIYGCNIVEYMHLFTAECVDAPLLECDEGELVWVDKSSVYNLNIWEGDKVFLKYIEEDRPFFFLKLIYSEDDELIEVV